MQTANVVICGAGIAGVSAAYHLAVTHGVRDVVLVDERDPLSLTSVRSTECYRNWWPGPGDAMVRLTNRSIDLLEGWARETGNRIGLNRRGYAYLSADPKRIPVFEAAAAEAANLGSGPVRRHTGQPGEAAYIPADPQGFESPLTGCDLLLDPGLVQQHFPGVTERAVALLHARRCGWFDAQQLGAYLLERARAAGVRVLRGSMERVEVEAGRVQAVHLAGPAAGRLATSRLVIAAGPFLRRAGQMLGLDLPVYCELHAKIAFDDHRNAIDRNAPLMIWTDPQCLPWSDDEREVLAENASTRYLLDEFPAGVHMRPEGGPGSRMALMLWTYDLAPREPVWPPVLDPEYPDIVLRGMAAMCPGLKAYFGSAARPEYDGGYYCKTRENRPLIGPLPVEGAYIIGALSGFGLLASPAAGELLAAHVTGQPLPELESWFRLERYEDPHYQSLLENWSAVSGQL